MASASSSSSPSSRPPLMVLPSFYRPPWPSERGGEQRAADCWAGSPAGGGRARATMGIDLNDTVSGAEEDAPPAPVCRELWHACAGPVVSLPRRGSAVVYLPQGHLAAAGAGGGIRGEVAVALPPHVACRVVDVELCADAATDEVYARLALVAEGEVFERNSHGGGSQREDDMEDGDEERKSGMLHMFCKTLTASDTSTHGGFSVPRRAAEDCFPPLDHKQLRPSQELVAKDLHGTKWRFRHIYRGQPRRHLLTTGWSSFVNKKKLVSGDAVLFLRGDDGELRLGVRRATQLKNEALFKAFSSDSSKMRTLLSVAESLKHGSVFHICYNPRSASEFIVPYWKFMKSFNHPVCIGMRFKFQFESEDVNERHAGMIAGVSEVDPIRWPGSKWQSLLVRWEGATDCNSQNRVSPWDIEIVGGSVSVAQSVSASSSKRTKLCPQGNLDTPSLYGNGRPDSVETEKFPRVLQGQELMGSRTHRVTCSPQPIDITKKVLQGQESSQGVPPLQGMMPDAYSAKSRHELKNHMYTPAAMSGLSAANQGYCLSLLSTGPPSPPSSLVLYQTGVPQLELASKNKDKSGNGSQPALPLHKLPGETCWEQLEIGNASTPGNAAKSGHGGREVGRTSCRLFGFSLTEKIVPTDKGGEKEGNYEADCQNPRMLDLFGYNCTTSGALHALCAAPLGI
ncbi:auxin response factor 3 isoform X2 [Oryza brachyantha]|uniref:auxin response factor 3 isoform X2 n=1 Tax=Oryza brachyantha TaxID=4533 RepID=UPI001ADA5691|nr:auxin response factor 3 isoform X2 [Oryza brachyantha]